MTWSESWQISASITIRTAYILRLLALLHQKCLVKKHITALTSVDFAGSHIVVVYISKP